MDVSLRLEHGLLAVEDAHEVHAMVAVTAPAAPVDRDRPPLRVALVLDRSGSMAGGPLEVVKRCAAFLVERLQPHDELALVAYDDEVDLLAALAPVQASVLGEAISAIHPGGMTNLSGGWLKGVEELGRRNDGLRRVLLLTDGLANQGLTEPDTLVALAQRQSAQGVATTTLGFGDGFNEELLTAMADAGRGTAHFIASPEDAPAAFAAEFSDLVSLVAQNVSVEIRPTDQVEVVAVLNDHPSTPVAGGVQVLAGDAYAGQQLRVVFKLALPSLAALGPAKVADVVLRFVSVGDEVAAHEVTYPLFVNLVSADEAATAVPDAEVVEEVSVLLAARAVEDARHRAEQGDLDGARDVLHDAAEALRGSAAGSARADELLASAEELTAVHTHLASGAFSPMSSKALHYNSRTMRRKRGGGPRP
ncbi:MAG TPA: VWA domain-containing protein [Egibacteraceae bacterium]|jgi:Ca-activated chloride channel homolog|nr:VWA domain-containing protein [Egibacteraceae bacterium]